MPTELNISLSSNAESPTIKFVLTDDLAATLSGSTPDIASNIKYVATGPQGEKGLTGASATAIISDGTVTDVKLASNSVTSSKIQPSAVTSSKLAAGSVTSSKIATNAITADKIAPGVVTAELLSDGAISSNKIGEGSIQTNKLENGSVTTAKIAPNTITKAKIAAKTLTGAEIEDNVVLDGAKIRGSVQLLGDSPAFLKGPNQDVLNIQSERDLVFRVDTNNNQSSSFLYKNGAGTTIFSIDESGNITTVGLVAGRNLVADGAKLDGISDNEAIDWTVAQTENIHNSNYTDTNTQLTTEEVQDIVGAMLTNNTETRIAVTYDDSDGTIDFVVDDMTADTNTQLPLIDDDTMATALSTNVASAESVKAYVDAQTHLELGTTNTTALAGDTTTISTAQANAITANTAKVGITTQQASDITANNAKVGITTQQASDITSNNSKTSFPGFGTTSGTALEGDTALLQLGTTSTTALAGDTTTISSAQASAITANTAKVGITTSQADAITANTAKPDLTVDGAGTVHANNYTDTQYSVMGSGNGYAAGLVKAGGILHSGAFLRKDGSWAIPPDTNTTYSEATSSAEGLMSTAHHDKLDGIAAGAEVNVQSDWNATSGDAQILNKPTIPAAYTDAEAVSAVAAADNYIKNDANEVLAGSLEINEQLFIVKSTGGSKTRFRNSATTTNRTLDVPDASGTIALTSDIPSFTPNPTIIGQFSTRVSAYWSGRYYFGQANYGWNYYAWNYATTSKTSMNDQYVHLGMVSPISTDNVKLRATVRNDSNTEDVELCLLKGPRPNGSSSNISLTELGSVTVTITTQDLHYNGDIDVTDANLSAGDLVFLAVRRVSSAANATKYINVTATIYGE